MMEGLESPDQDEDEVDEGDISDGQPFDDDEDGSCSRFSENDAIESSGHSGPSNAEEAEEIKSQNGFEELIGYTQEEEDQVDKGQIKAKVGGNLGKNRTDSFNIAPSKGPEQQKKEKQKAKSNTGRTNNDLHNSKTKSQAKSEYLYALVGVLVHSGSANAGHYYSYIKERKTFEEAA